MGEDEDFDESDDNSGYSYGNAASNVSSVAVSAIAASNAVSEVATSTNQVNNDPTNILNTTTSQGPLPQTTPGTMHMPKPEDMPLLSSLSSLSSTSIKFPHKSPETLEGLPQAADEPMRPRVGRSSHSTMNIDILASAATEELKVLEKAYPPPIEVNPANSRSLPSLTDYFNSGKAPKFPGYQPSSSLNNLQYLSSVALVSNGSYTTLSNLTKTHLNTLSALQKMTPLKLVHQPTPNRSHIIADRDMDYVQQRLKKSRPNSPSSDNFTLPNSPVLGLSVTNTPIISASNSSTNLTSFFGPMVGAKEKPVPAVPRQMNHTPPPQLVAQATSPMQVDSPGNKLPPLRSLKLDLPTNLSMPNLMRGHGGVSSSLGSSGPHTKLEE